MKILVCIKQVPGTSNVQVDPVTGVLIRQGVECKLNPYDLYGLELAMRLSEKYGGVVRAITMGPPQAEAAVLEALYMGVDSGCVVSDRRFAGADVLATSYTLSQGIKKMGDFDLIICGKQTTDGDTAQVGAETAEFLQIPYAGNVVSVEDISGGKITVRSNFENLIITQKLPLPCLMSTEADINTPRLPSYKRKKQISGGKVSFLSLDDFEDKNENHYGLEGSPTSVERIFPPERHNEKITLQGCGNELSQKLFELLQERKFI